MSDFKTIETQEDFDKAIGERLKRERETLEKKYAGFDALKEKADKYDELVKQDFEGQIKRLTGELNTAREKAAGHEQTVSDLTARAVKAETSLMKNRIAHESGIPLELAARLSGETEDDIRKDAEMFSQFVGGAGKSAPPLHSSEPSAASNKEEAQTAALRAMMSQLLPNS